MGSLAEELTANHRALLSASTAIISNTANLTTAGNNLVSLFERIETKLKELATTEENLKKKEEEIAATKKKNEEDIDKRIKEIKAKKTELDTREEKLNKREQNIVQRENALQELETRMETNAKKIQAIIPLSIGGAVFEVPKANLLQFKGSYFEAMLTTDHPQQFNGKYYIDYTSEHFLIILDYMRSGKIGKAFFENQKEIKAHFEFFKLPFPGVLHESILKWLPQRHFTLLYKATRDGFGCNVFHKMCDNRGPTISIIESDKGYIFGGYTPISWGNNPTTARDATNPDFFIFTLTNPHKISQTQYKLNIPNEIGITSKENYHINFGKGPSCFEIQVASDNANLIANSLTFMGSNLATSYKSPNTGYIFTDDGFIIVKEINIYLVV